MRRGSRVATPTDASPPVDIEHAVGFEASAGPTGLDHALLDAFPEHAYLLSDEHRILAVNSAALEQLRTTKGELSGKLFHPAADSSSALRRMLNECASRGRSRRTEVRFSVPGGRTLSVLMRASRLADESGKRATYLVVGFDISRVESALRRSESLALLDPLTGAYNRHFLTKLIRHEAARGLRYGFPIGFIMADVDGLKRINDRHGHLVGDSALRAAATQLHGALRASDVLVRYGGDEFLAVMPQTAAAVAMIESRIRSRLAGLMVSVGREAVPVGVSLGSSYWLPRPDGPSPLDAIEQADQRLYEGRRSARLLAA